MRESSGPCQVAGALDAPTREPRRDGIQGDDLPVRHRLPGRESTHTLDQPRNGHPDEGEHILSLLEGCSEVVRVACVCTHPNTVVSHLSFTPENRRRYQRWQRLREYGFAWS